MIRTLASTLFLVFALAALAPACETSKLGDCAPGLVLDGGKCVPAGTVCGPGTVLSDGLCVPVG